MGVNDAYNTLITALADKDAWIRLHAAQALEILKDKRAVDSFIEALNDEDENVSSTAAAALEKIGKPAVNPLIEVFKDEDEDVISCAREILTKIGRPAVSALIEALKDENVNVRMFSAQTLGKIGDKKAVEPLIKTLKLSTSISSSVANLLRIPLNSSSRAVFR